MYTFEDTVPMMLSDDIDEQLKAEYIQVKIRYEKLKDELLNNNIVDTSSREFNLLIIQKVEMLKYLMALEQRLKIHNINIDDIKI